MIRRYNILNILSLYTRTSFSSAVSVLHLNKRTRSASPVDRRESRRRTPPPPTSLAPGDSLTHSHWPDSASLNVNVTASELSSFLTYAQTLTPAYIHPRPISFATTQKRANWKDSMGSDINEWDYYDCLRKNARRGFNRLALFATWTQSWVGTKNWRDADWHCWGAAMLDRPTGYGKHLVLFDCDADMSQDFTKLRPKDFMLPTQVDFVQWARHAYKIESVWYGNAGCKPKPRQCVLSTAIWIESFAPQLEPRFEGPEDSRLSGFVEIERR